MFKRTLALVLFLLPFPVLAEFPETPPELGLEWINFGAYRKVQHPKPVADGRLFSELRPQADWKLTENLRAVSRLRANWSMDLTRNTPDRSINTIQDTRFLFDEVYATYRATETVSFAAGTQNYQWGPSELMSPSNPIFHFYPQFRNFYFKQLGRALLRVNADFSENWNAVALFEPIANQEDAWLANRGFHSRGALKIERRLGSGSDHIGLSLGVMEGPTAFVGLYSSVYVTEGFSAYIETRHSKGSPAYYPTGIGFSQNRKGEDSIYTMALMGLRFEDVIDARTEFLWNGYGYTDGEFGTALTAVYFNPALLGTFLRPGLEITKRRYLYLSIRDVKLISSDRFHAALRYLRSLEEGSLSKQSGLLWSNLDYALSERVTGYFEPTVRHGNELSEFGQTFNWELLLGLRVVW